MASGPRGRFLRLLLDEHISPEVAHRLRAKGHDIVAVAESRTLAGRPDRMHFASAPSERRAIVTRDVRDFRPLLAHAMRSGEATYGLICLSYRWRLSARGIGELADALDALLRTHPEDDAAVRRGGEIWL